MRCYTSGEYRGQEEKTAKSGVRYYVLNFEEENTGKPFNMVSDRPCTEEKGTPCTIDFDLEQGYNYTKIKVVQIVRM